MLKKVVVIVMFVITLMTLTACDFAPSKRTHTCMEMELKKPDGEIISIYKIDDREVSEVEYWVHRYTKH